MQDVRQMPDGADSGTAATDRHMAGSFRMQDVRQMPNGADSGNMTEG